MPAALEDALDKAEVGLPCMTASATCAVLPIERRTSIKE
jgi:hypothetical protein